MEKIIKQLESKKARLERVLTLNPPIAPTPESLEAHERRISNAKTFLDELAEVTLVLDIKADVKLVNLATLEKYSDKADFCNVEFDGEFCKLVLIQNFPYNDLWLLYVGPVEAI